MSYTTYIVVIALTLYVAVRSRVVMCEDNLPSTPNTYM